MNDPRRTALLDQAQAAWHDAETTLQSLAAIAGTPTVHGKLGPLSIKLVDSLVTRGMAGQLTLCPHLSYEHPAPADWCAYAPGRLRCRPCTIAVMARVAGTTEDRRCDICRTTLPRGAKIYAAQTVLPPHPDVVRNRRTGQLAPVPPITVHFGLCPACRTEDGCWP